MLDSIIRKRRIFIRIIVPLLACFRFFDSRINHAYIVLYLSLFLLMLFMRLYLTQMRLHIVTRHNTYVVRVFTKYSIFFLWNNIILISAIILKKHYFSRIRAVTFELIYLDIEDRY